MKDLDIKVENPASLDGMQGTISMAKLKSVAKEMAENWITPTCIVAFLVNSWKEKIAGWVIPWKDFWNLL